MLVQQENLGQLGQMANLERRDPTAKLVCQARKVRAEEPVPLDLLHQSPKNYHQAHLAMRRGLDRTLDRSELWQAQSILQMMCPVCPALLDRPVWSAHEDPTANEEILDYLATLDL